MREYLLDRQSLIQIWDYERVMTTKCKRGPYVGIKLNALLDLIIDIFCTAYQKDTVP